MGEERHSYVTAGISDDVFRGIGAQATAKDPDLTYFVHFHRWVPQRHGGSKCNERCEIIRNGQVEKVEPVLVESTSDQSGDGNG